MGKYLARKILFMVPAFFVVTLIGFFFSAMAPGDPVEIITGNTASQGTMQVSRSSASIKDSVRNQLGLNLPLFYFSIGTAADPEDLHTIKSPLQRKAIKYLSRKYGRPNEVLEFYTQLEQLKNQADTFPAERTIKAYADTLLAHGYPDSTVRHMAQGENVLLTQALEGNSQLLRSIETDYHAERVLPALDSVAYLFSRSRFTEAQKRGAMKARRSLMEIVNPNKSESGSKYLPAFNWNGSNNQYHRWLGNLFNGHFGYSYVDGQPVHTKIWEKFFRSFILILLSVLLAYFISIPAGVYSAQYKNRWPDKTFSWFSFILFSLPSYFVGTMLLLLFANTEYFAWFPESGYCDPETYNPNAPWLTRVWHQLPFMVLPIITYTYGSFAFISRLVRSSMLENLNADYIRTARAKGLSERTVLWKHALRNSYLPVITMFVNILPAAIGGSVIVESIFSYPGMGLESVSAIHHADHPMLISIVVFAGFMTMIAYFIADLLYLWADPRIAYDKE